MANTSRPLAVVVSMDAPSPVADEVHQMAQIAP